MKKAVIRVRMYRLIIYLSLHYSHLVKCRFHALCTMCGLSFLQISTVLEYWVWLEKYFLPTLYMAKYHNGTDMVKWWDRRCINDFMSMRVGIARMRQMRIKEGNKYIVAK